MLITICIIEGNIFLWNFAFTGMAFNMNRCEFDNNHRRSGGVASHRRSGWDEIWGWSGWDENVGLDTR